MASVHDILGGTNTSVSTLKPKNGESAADRGSKQLSDNFDNFLLLLTTQLKNQDPTEPLDTNQFTAQLVQFTGVEQQVNANKNLEKLVALNQASATNAAVGYVGNIVEAEGSSSVLKNGKAEFIYGLNGAASTVDIVITDSRGFPIYKGKGDTGAGKHTFVWNGVASSGVQSPDGVYKIQVTAKNAEGKEVETYTRTVGQVERVNFEGQEVMLHLAGDIEVALGDIKGLSKGNSDTPATPVPTTPNTGSNVQFDPTALIGKTVQVIGDTAKLENGQAHYGYILEKEAALVDIFILDENGNRVFRTRGSTNAGENDFVWNGLNSEGETMPEGKYTIEISAVDRNNKKVESAPYVVGEVTRVGAEDGGITITVGGNRVPLELIVGITKPLDTSA